MKPQIEVLTSLTSLTWLHKSLYMRAISNMFMKTTSTMSTMSTKAAHTTVDFELN
jgi:hypothetical protein